MLIQWSIPLSTNVCVKHYARGSNKLKKATEVGLKFMGYQFSWFLWRIRSTNSSTHEMVIFCMIMNPTNMSFLLNPRKLVPTKIKPSTVFKDMQHSYDHKVFDLYICVQAKYDITIPYSSKIM